jgi:hypothetical protein
VNDPRWLTSKRLAAALAEGGRRDGDIRVSIAGYLLPIVHLWYDEIAEVHRLEVDERSMEYRWATEPKPTPPAD